MTRFTLLFCVWLASFQDLPAQVLQMTDSKKGKVVQLAPGDKVLLAYAISPAAYAYEFEDIFIRPSKETLETSTPAYIHRKARIERVTDSSLVLRDGAELRLDQLAGLRRLGPGKQLLRGTGKVLGIGGLLGGSWLSGVQVAGETGAPIWVWMGVTALGLGLHDLCRDEVPQRHLHRWTWAVGGQVVEP